MIEELIEVIDEEDQTFGRLASRRCKFLNLHSSWKGFFARAHVGVVDTEGRTHTLITHSFPSTKHRLLLGCELRTFNYKLLSELRVV